MPALQTAPCRPAPRPGLAVALRGLTASLALAASLARAATGLAALPASGDDGPVTLFYPTQAAPRAVQRGPFILPLVEAGCVDSGHLIADAKSGVSGAGRNAETGILFSEASDNFKAYGVPGHRHLPEIRQGLSAAAGHAVGLTFVPHLTPMIRGIHATLYARITREEDFQSLFEARYADEPFVDVLPPKSHPETRSVRAANTCRIAVHRPQGGDTLVVLSVIDNLVKGAAGQAVQNMNIMFGFDECLGLLQIPVLP